MWFVIKNDVRGRINVMFPRRKQLVWTSAKCCSSRTTCINGYVMFAGNYSAIFRQHYLARRFFARWTIFYDLICWVRIKRYYPRVMGRGNTNRNRNSNLTTTKKT